MASLWPLQPALLSMSPFMHTVLACDTFLVCHGGVLNGEWCRLSNTVHTPAAGSTAPTVQQAVPLAAATAQAAPATDEEASAAPTAVEADKETASTAQSPAKDAEQEASGESTQQDLYP